MGGQAPGSLIALADIPLSLPILDDMAWHGKAQWPNEKTLYSDSVFNFTYVLQVECPCWAHSMCKKFELHLYTRVSRGMYLMTDLPKKEGSRQSAVRQRILFSIAESLAKITIRSH
jgi:hypothetical protein